MSVFAFIKFKMNSYKIVYNLLVSLVNIFPFKVLLDQLMVLTSNYLFILNFINFRLNRGNSIL